MNNFTFFNTHSKLLPKHKFKTLHLIFPKSKYGTEIGSFKNNINKMIKYWWLGIEITDLRTFYLIAIPWQN